ncbi:ankyrin repeat-containing domain protein [Thelonectria olida]|uniref:Ankyrin repeat-containing domain protein n=1 Tax=Thelonectria olida TaxID=1576542 RepID=A0A9P9ANM8_9HYPO|nr:ankyrin repeat-containing domain protein [Thelonectria olida]
MPEEDGHESPWSGSDESTLFDFHGPSEIPAYAIISGNRGQARALAAAGAYNHPADAWVIYEACLQGPAMIQALSVNPILDLSPRLPGQMGDTVFHLLLRTHPSRFPHTKIATIMELLQAGVDPLQPDRFGNTALHILAGVPTDMQDDAFELMKLLFGNQATPLVRLSCISSVNHRSGVDSINNSESSSTPLQIGVIHNHISCVKLLLDNGASPHVRGLFNKTPLYFAVIRDFVDVADVLLRHGAALEGDMLAQSPEMSLVLTRNTL